MVAIDRLKDLLHDSRMSRRDKVLIVLATDKGRPKAVKEIKQTAITAGLRAVKGWNISDILAKGTTFAVLTPNGWELNSAGKSHIAALVGPIASPVISSAAVDLRAKIGGITDVNTRSFLDEAAACLEGSLLRAAVVLSWVGAVSVLYCYVVNHEFAAFNSEARRRDAKWRTAKGPDDLALMKEADFLNVLQSISVIGKSVKSELKACLDLRNACGHPNSLKLGSNRVASHIETLILNVFARF